MWSSAVGCIVMFTLGLLIMPLAAVAQQLAKVARIGYLVIGALDAPRPGSCSTPSAKDSANTAMWRGRTSSLSTAPRTGRSSGYRVWQPNWPISRSISSSRGIPRQRALRGGGTDAGRAPATRGGAGS